MEPKLRFKEFSGDWEEKKLGDIGFFKNGISKGKESFGKGYKFINLQDVFNTNYLKNKKYDLVELTEKELLENDLRKGDVIFVRSSVKPSGVGLTSVVLEDLIKTSFAGFLIRFREYTTILDLNYKRYCFYFPKFRKELLKKSSVSANTNINQDNLAKLKINIPLLPEQTKIADFLSTVDEKIQNQQDKITHLENIKKGFMQKIFSRKIRFKDANGNEFPEWEEKKLGDICKIIGGGTPDTKKTEYWNGDIQWFTPTEIGLKKYVYKSKRTITDKGLKNSSAKILPKGTILLSTRATIGQMSIASIDCSTNQGFQSLIVDNNNSNEYIYYLQNKIRAYAIKNSSGSTFLEISKNNLSKCKIEVPCLEEQQKIADFLSSFDEKIDVEKEILDHLKELKKGLLQQMFV